MRKDTDYDDKKDEPTRRLDQDYDSPFSPPSDAKQHMPVDDPSKDTRADLHEEYDEGSDDASLDNKPGGESASGPRPHKVF